MLWEHSAKKASGLCLWVKRCVILMRLTETSLADICHVVFSAKGELVLMEEKDAFERVKKVAIAQLSVNPDEVTLEASFTKDLGADSLDQVELVMALEEEFGMEIPDEDAEKITTVGEAVKYISANL